MKPLLTGSFVFCLLALLLLTACSQPVVGQGNPDLLSGDILFQDDFSNKSSGWGEWDEADSMVKYEMGGLRILVKEPQFDYWSVAGRQFSDVRVEVDTEMIGGTTDNDFGLICRYQDQENFYMLLVSSDGYFGIAKMKAGEYTMIGSEQLQYSTAIAQGKSTNRLRGDCVGQTLILYANDQKLMEVTDHDFSKGDVGLLAGAYDQVEVDILFDNFMVKKP